MAKPTKDKTVTEPATESNGGKKKSEVKRLSAETIDILRLYDTSDDWDPNTAVLLMRSAIAGLSAPKPVEETQTVFACKYDEKRLFERLKREIQPLMQEACDAALQPYVSKT